MTTQSLDRGRKRSREEKDDSPSTSTTTATRAESDDSIAHFLATLSPPPKVARTALQFVARRPPSSNWHSLPGALIPLICQHFSSWRDLLRLCRVHRCFDDCIVSPATAASCWKNVAAVRLRVDRKSELGADGEGYTVVTINDRPLLIRALLPLTRSTSSADRRLAEQYVQQQRSCFRSLQYVPRLSWSGRLDNAAQFIAVLPEFTTLRHLHIHSLTSPSWPDARPPPMNNVWRAFGSLVSLTLDSTHHLFVDEPYALHGLSIRYLSATTDFIQALLTTDRLASSTLASSLAYIHCSGSTHWLPWSLPLLPNLQHVHAGEKTAVRFDQRFMSHKRPAAGSSGRGSSECQLLSYAVRQSEELLHSRLTFPALVCLSLHGKEQLELQVLLSLSELPSLRQLTLSRRAAWSQFQEERSLPLASLWLPQLTTVDYLDVKCEQSVDSDWLSDLLFVCIDPDAEAAMIAVRRRLQNLALQLPSAMDEEEVRGWRLSESSWPALQHCSLAWATAHETNGPLLETRNVAGHEGCCGCRASVPTRAADHCTSGQALDQQRRHTRVEAIDTLTPLV